MNQKRIDSMPTDNSDVDYFLARIERLENEGKLCSQK